jgi:cyclase
MLLPRIIPVLLIKNKGLYKGIKFKNHVYVGDPINTVKIFNDKQVDELIILDIEASKKNTPPDVNYIQSIISEAFMPVGYGGGISDVETATRLFQCGVEKIILNTAAFRNPLLVQELAKKFGSQSVVISLDIKKNIFGKSVCTILSGTKTVSGSPLEWALKFQEFGAGEIILNNVDNDGSMEGYDLKQLKLFGEKLKIPVVACGGAGNAAHLKDALRSGAHGCAAGSMFVFQGKLRGVLISYLSQSELKDLYDFRK